MTERATGLLQQPFTDAVMARPLPDLSEVISDFIARRLPPASHPLGAAARHHFAAPGKQIRARMALAAADSFGVPRIAALPWAAAVEVLHNASLVHDDICDGDKVRRGHASVWSRYGRDMALALGDWLIALSFELAAEAAHKGRTPLLVSLLARHMSATTSGQALEFGTDLYPEWSDYMNISTGKTAPLLIAPAEGIAHLAGRRDVLQPLVSFFTAAGACYQIANDMLNVAGTDGANSPASDLMRRAPNAVIVMFLTTLDRNSAADFDKWLASCDTTRAPAWQAKLRRSLSMQMTASSLLNMMEQAEASSAQFPVDCHAVIAPIQSQLHSVCHKLVSDYM